MLQLINEIEAEFIKAFKEKDILKKNLLGIIKSRVSEWKADKRNTGKNFSNESLMDVLGSEVKKINQTLDAYKNQDQSDDKVLKAVFGLNRELEILKSFMPQQMTEEEIKSEIDKVAATNPDKLMPAVMKYFNENFKGKYDNKTLQSLLR